MRIYYKIGTNEPPSVGYIDSEDGLLPEGAVRLGRDDGEQAVREARASVDAFHADLQAGEERAKATRKNVAAALSETLGVPEADLWVALGIPGEPPARRKRPK